MLETTVCLSDCGKLLVEKYLVGKCFSPDQTLHSGMFRVHSRVDVRDGVSEQVRLKFFSKEAEWTPDLCTKLRGQLWRSTPGSAYSSLCFLGQMLSSVSYFSHL